MRSLYALVFVVACTTSYDYDPAGAGDQEGSARPPQSKTSSQFVRGIYADLLGRTPETYDFTLSINGTQAVKFTIDEETTLDTALDGVGDPVPMRALVVDGLLHSTEITIPEKSADADAKAYITDQIKRLLGRDPNVYELAAVAVAWATDPAVGARSIIRAIAGWRAYQCE
jgi:hypothetical protein